LHTTFQLLDGDRDGKINATDLQRFLGTFNASYTLFELEELIEVPTASPPIPPSANADFEG
jgi:Ca2+-binding EF-hand superfamily protein